MSTEMEAQAVKMMTKKQKAESEARYAMLPDWMFRADTQQGA
jgi:hypothetical protein